VSRRAYLDWLRGVAVLIMVEAHTLDSWTQRPIAAAAITSGRSWSVGSARQPFCSWLVLRWRSRPGRASIKV
jgi:peptidoglycan/LPS O-acetylase OafA/YrhL